MTDYENIIKHYDLYKSYGEFYFLFEDTIQEYRLLIISIIRISYEYFEEEDDEENELPYYEQDRLLKIMMNNMGAKEIIENCKVCFVDFFNRQKQKYGSFIFKWYNEEKKIYEQSFDFAMVIFKKSLQLIELRNIIIHSHYNESLSVPEINRENLKAQKDIKTSKGYEQRNFTLDINFLEKMNNQIQILQYHLRKIGYFFYLNDEQKENYSEELEQLKLINFVINSSNYAS